jgi:hypothetical protein
MNTYINHIHHEANRIQRNPHKQERKGINDVNNHKTKQSFHKSTRKQCARGKPEYTTAKRKKKYSESSSSYCTRCNSHLCNSYAYWNPPRNLKKALNKGKKQVKPKMRQL